ncbi:MAG: hypothetical protein WCG29_02750 [Desulfomonile sp.]
MQTLDSPAWNSRIRIAFWIIGICCGGITAYTTRYFVNGDAIAYIEMGESLRWGQWRGLANLTYSPGYPFLLGIAQTVLHTNPLNELQLLRTVNFACLLCAMGTCEILMSLVRRALLNSPAGEDKPISLHIIRALGYSMFLVASLVFIRVRLLNPDMLVFAVVLAVASLLLWIRENSESYRRYILLGLSTGLGYITKSFFLPFSPIFFVLAGSCANSFRKAIPRVIVAIIALVIVAAPLVAALSCRLGRFSYGELGPHIYATLIAGKGEPTTPELLNTYPKVYRFIYGIQCTRPSGFDICYWHDGLKPVLDLRAQLAVIPDNVSQIFKDTPWLILIIVWYLILWRLGKIKIGPLIPPSLFLMLITPAVFGIVFYCLIRMEMRYIAPYLFLGFLAVVVSLRFSEASHKVYLKAWWLSVTLISFFLLMVAHSSIDQSIRGLISTNNRLSYRDSLREEVIVKDFLDKKGIRKGDLAAVVGSPPVYWARMAGITIVAEIPSLEEFMNSSEKERRSSLEVLRASNIKAVVAKGDVFAHLNSEGWQLVAGTRDYFVVLLAEKQLGNG